MQPVVNTSAIAHSSPPAAHSPPPTAREPVFTAHGQVPTSLRLSFYLSLALASLCLAWAEFGFLPWMLYAWPVLVVVMVVAHRREGQWVLSACGANWLGVGILLGAVAWLVVHYWLEMKGRFAPDIPWPAGMLPHLGPLLVLLLLVKLFRPKTILDVWVTQTLGLMMVTLGCVLTGAVSFGLLLAGYLVSACWFLSIFFLYREQLASVPGALLQPADQLCLPWYWRGLGAALRWAALSLGIAFMLFLLVPRQAHKQWDAKLLATTFGPQLARSGDDNIDLNSQGPIELGDGLAFTVAASDAHGPKADLPVTQRWRGPTLDYYSNGRWKPWQKQHDPRDAFFQSGQAAPTTFRNNLVLPYLGPEQFFIDFHVVPRQAGTLVLAEPVVLGPDPGIHPYRAQRASFFYEIPGNSTLTPVPQPRRPEYRYRQVVLPSGLAGRPASSLSPEYIRYLLEQAVPQPISAQARILLPGLPGLSGQADLFDNQGKVPGKYWRKCAEALCRYLAHSGQYTYSLQQPRQDLQTDPTVDFLLNVRSGHCSRFAGGLALLLRSVGIPTRLIKGYQGAEHVGEGNYVIRQNQAHSWVEVLVPGDQTSGPLSWLSLDPTPPADNPAAKHVWSQWLFDSWQDGRVLWQNLVLDYGGEQQAGLVENLGQRLYDPHLWEWVSGLLQVLGYLAGGAILVLSALVLWKKRRSRTRTDVRGAPVPFFTRLLAVLEQRCQLRPGPAQTPREFAQAVSAVLRLRPIAVHLADCPLRAADCLYRLRYGGEQLTTAEELDLLQLIQELDSSLINFHQP